MKIVFNEEYAETPFVFRDRLDAGLKLGEWINRQNPRVELVYGIPAGGIPVAYNVASVLGIKLDVLICRKLLVPWNREIGFGAVSPDGFYYYDSLYARYLGLSDRDIDKAIEEQLLEIKRRIAKYRCSEPYRDLEGRDILVVDDGIAAGYTMKAAIMFLRKINAGRVVVAVPTCHVESAVAISRDADELYCYNPRSPPLYAVADAYREWSDLGDEEVLDILRSARDRGILAYRAKCI